MSRERRKVEHIDLALKLQDGPSTTGFDDIKLVHCALPNLALKEIDTRCQVFNKQLSAPLVINAITGGARELANINAALARVAKECGIGMAVGSQTAALERRELSETFTIARKANPKGLLLANIGAHVKPALAKVAVEMLEADALQIHLNVAQELMMPEGDRDFNGYLENIIRIAETICVPTIVKEVGFGLNYEAAAKLYECGIRNIDIGGSGGTNFIAVEQSRESLQIECDHLNKDTFYDWGIPTVVSIIEATYNLKWDNIIATGGIRNALHCIKSLALGANLVGIAGSFLRILLQESEHRLIQKVEKFKNELKMLMVLTGAKSLEELPNTPVVITGATREWLQERGFNTAEYAQRFKNEGLLS